MTAKCEFCAGTGIEPGFDECVWCDNTGTKEGQSLFDPAKPGSDITVAATFKLDGKSLRLQSLVNVAASCEPSECRTCGGTRLVDDGELHCSAGGTPYENGPIKCVKDCPDCLVKVCAASLGGVHCKAPRAKGSLFCGQHRHSSNRLYLPRITNESLAFMMQRDGKQQ